MPTSKDNDEVCFEHMQQTLLSTFCKSLYRSLLHGMVLLCESLSCLIFFSLMLEVNLSMKKLCWRGYVLQ